jgi:hypothetical protein
MMTVIELGWGRSYAIPNDKVSKFLELFGDMHEVDSVYTGDVNLTWYYKDKSSKLNMHVVDNFITETYAMSLRNEYQEKQNGA